MRRIFLAMVVAVGCGSAAPSPHEKSSSSPDAGADAPLGSAAIPLACAGAAQLAAWQGEIDLFDGGFRPTGSPAHEGYIKLLTTELAALGVRDVHTEAYAFTKWTPAAWSLDATPGAMHGPIALSGYIPYSGSTGPKGIDAPMVYIPPSALPISAVAIADALSDPDATTKALAARLQASLAAMSGALVGKIVLFDVPKITLSMSQLTGQTAFVNDATGELQRGGSITRTDVSAMLTMNAVMNAIAAAGAVAAVGILDLPEEAARGLYAPFFGTTAPDLPGVYVDRATGAKLRSAATGGLLAAHLVLDAAVGDVTSENVVGVLPGASSEEIILGSHTDGPNSIEDNGPVALLGLASCLAPLPQAERPRTIRFVLSGGHFIGSKGLQSYVSVHGAELSAKARVVIELEHLGAREWSEVAPGTMGLTGRPEMQLVSVTPGASRVDAGIAFAKLFPRTIVATPPVLGEGQNFRVIPLIQFLSMPEYLLVGRLPAITAQLTDYDLMAKQVAAFIDMEKVLAAAP